MSAFRFQNDIIACSYNCYLKAANSAGSSWLVLLCCCCIVIIYIYTCMIHFFFCDRCTENERASEFVRDTISFRFTSYRYPRPATSIEQSREAWQVATCIVKWIYLHTHNINSIYIYYIYVLHSCQHQCIERIMSNVMRRSKAPCCRSCQRTIHRTVATTLRRSIPTPLHPTTIGHQKWELHSRRRMGPLSSSSTTSTTWSPISYQSLRHRIHRTFSSSTKQKHPFENTFGVTFTISPDQAFEKFIQWAQVEQGLYTSLMNPDRAQVTAAYCPVWSFDLNIRFLVTNTQTQRKRLDWKPTLFRSVYGTQSIVHLPGISAYAGYTYRRTLIDPLHNTTLVFMSDKIVPFGAWMLRDMTSTRRTTIPVVPDPWNAPPGRALSVVKTGLESLTENDETLAKDDTVRVQVEVVQSRRVYMPTYVVTYYILGMEYVGRVLFFCFALFLLVVGACCF